MKGHHSKSKNMWLILSASLSIVGAIVGIGFVSGKEIVSFFFKYRGLSFALALLSSIGLFLCVILGTKQKVQTIEQNTNNNNKKRKMQRINMKNSIKTRNVANNTALFDESTKLKVQTKNSNCNIYKCENNHKNKYRKKCDTNIENVHISANNVGWFFKTKAVMIGCFQVIISGCMMAGVFDLVGLAVASSAFSSAIVKIVLFCVIFLLLVFAENRVLKVSSIASFVLIGIMILCLCFGYVSISSSDTVYLLDDAIFSTNIFAGVCSSIFYVSMNMLSCTGVLSIVSQKDLGKASVFWIAILSSGILLLLIFLILSVYSVYPELASANMPLLALAKNSADWLYYLYYFGLVLGGCFALLSVIFSAIKSFETTKMASLLPFWLKVLFVMLVALLFSFVGFGVLVDYVYPLIGSLYLILSCVQFFVFGGYKKQ